MNNYRDFLPDAWLEIIDRDPVLTEVFSIHEYASDFEPVFRPVTGLF